MLDRLYLGILVQSCFPSLPVERQLEICRIVLFFTPRFLVCFFGVSECFLCTATFVWLGMYVYISL